jgi:glycosyltransferase involved in cell wall biosynthesis
MRIAITYHYSLALGGSERVLEVLAEMYPEADFFTLFVDRRFIPEKLKGRKITTSFLNRLPGKERLYRHLLPMYPMAVESLDLSGYDLVISADGAATKGVLTDQEALHLCYCHSPSRSFWDQYAANRSALPWFARAMFAPISQYMRMWDFAAAQRIDGFIASSRYVADRISKYYRRDSTVIHPPVATDGAYLATTHDDYYLSVGRLVSSKQVDILIYACNQLQRNLRIAGSGPDETRLRSLAGPTIEFLGRIDDQALKLDYARSRALLFAADEDFGLVPVEAQAFGRPVIAYGHGGSRETVVEINPDPPSGRVARSSPPTGLFFAEQTADSLMAAILQFESVEHRFDPREIQRHARQFDTSIFVSQMHGYVDRQLEKRQLGRIEESSLMMAVT